MPAHSSQTSLYLSLRQQSDYVIDGPNSAILAPGQTAIANGPFVSTSSWAWCYLVYPGMTSTTGIFIERKDMVCPADGSGPAQITGIRDNHPGQQVTLYYGGYEGPDFIVPGWTKSFTVYNGNAAAIYIRRGTPNASGIAVGKPGDANSNDVQGAIIPAGVTATFDPGSFVPGDRYHILATASSQKAVVNFF